MTDIPQQIVKAAKHIQNGFDVDWYACYGNIEMPSGLLGVYNEASLREALREAPTMVGEPRENRDEEAAFVAWNDILKDSTKSGELVRDALQEGTLEALYDALVECGDLEREYGDDTTYRALRETVRDIIVDTALDNEYDKLHDAVKKADRVLRDYKEAMKYVVEHRQSMHHTCQTLEEKLEMEDLEDRVHEYLDTALTYSNRITIELAYFAESIDCIDNALNPDRNTPVLPHIQ